ncbi:hypothetical protein BJY00DRAFT_294188 [Aspergillus carlsbadensis]|nr:hypothetical protein BJY00DRAFT_294188 [Aspergillus carlsbadensis]
MFLSSLCRACGVETGDPDWDWGRILRLASCENIPSLMAGLSFSGKSNCCRLVHRELGVIIDNLTALDNIEDSPMCGSELEDKTTQRVAVGHQFVQAVYRRKSLMRPIIISSTHFSRQTLTTTFICRRRSKVKSLWIFWMRLG